MTRCQRCQKLLGHPSVTFVTSLDCASRNSRWLSQRRMEAKSVGRSPTGFGGLDPQPAELLEYSAGTAYLVWCGELGPVLAVDGPGGVAVAHVSLTDALQ